MARAGRKDRGLVPRRLASGQLVYDVRLYHLGRARYFALGEPNKTRARHWYEDRKREQREGKFYPEQWQQGGGELIQALLDDYLLTTSGKRAVNRERTFARWWGHQFTGQRTEALTPHAMQTAQNALSSGGRSQATVNRYTDWFRHVCNWALRQKRLRDNPVLGILRKPEEEGTAIPYTVEQEARLAEALGSPYDEWVRLGILTGLRQGNQFTLRKEWLNLKGRTAVLPRTKNRRPQVLHLSREAVRLLRRQLARTPAESPWVYPSTRNRRDERPLNARWFMDTIFKPACRLAELPHLAKPWHALRHTFGTRLGELGYRESDIMQAGGWLNSRAVQRYIHPAEPRLKEAAERLSRMRNRQGTARKTATRQKPILK